VSVGRWMTFNLLLGLGLVTPLMTGEAMTTKTVQFFSQLDEFLIILRSVISNQKLYVILYRGGEKPEIAEIETELNASVVYGFGASRVYLAKALPDMASIDPGNLRPAPLGWIQVDLPRERGAVLYMGQIAMKSDWLDREQGTIRDNLELKKVYDRVTRQMKRHLISPVVAENVVTGSKAIYRNIYYLLSAKAFAGTGGELMQEGVKNIRFSLPEMGVS